MKRRNKHGRIGTKQNMQRRLRGERKRWRREERTRDLLRSRNRRAK